MIAPVHAQGQDVDSQQLVPLMHTALPVSASPLFSNIQEQARKGVTYNSVDNSNAFTSSTKSQTNELPNLALGIPTRRFLDRHEADGYHSTGEYNINHIGGLTICQRMEDWYHSILNWPTYSLVLLIVGLYYFFFLFYAILYYTYVAGSCQRSMHSFLDCLYFSISVMMTVGLGADDIYFKECTLPIFIFSSETIVGVLLGSCVVGMLFSRLGRGEKRATSITFSTHAIVRKIENKWCFIFRIIEQRKHQLLQTNIKLYTIRDDPNPDVNSINESYFQFFPMHIDQPDASIDSSLIMCVPTTIVHFIDEKSPLFPHDDDVETIHPFISGKSMATTSLVSGASSITVNSNKSSRSRRPSILIHASVPINDSFSTSSYASTTTSSFSSSSSSSTSNYQNHSPNILKHNQSSLPQKIPISVSRLQRHMHRINAEILAVVEGTDSITGHIIQCRYSYHFQQGDVLFDHAFAQIVSKENQDGGCLVDLSRFHDTHPIDNSEKSSILNE
jgi:hypothetical protein